LFGRVEQPEIIYTALAGRVKAILQILQEI
jgi:hypothetical protein